MIRGRIFWVGLSLLAGVAAATAAAAAPAPKPAKPVHEEGPADVWQPMTEAMERLGLTDLQRRILAQVFHQYTYERPPAAADAPLAVEVEPVAPGGLYRLGPEGDLPVRLQVHVRATGQPGAVRLRYLVQDFYGRKVAGADLPKVFPDAAGTAEADLAVEEATAAGYYHVLVTAASRNRTASAACGVAVVPPSTAAPNAESAFGLLAPAGPVPGDVPEVARRLGARHLALDWDGTAEALEAVRAGGLVPVPVVPINSLQQPRPEAFASRTAEAIAPLAEAAPAWQLGRRPVLDREALAFSADSYRRTVSELLRAVRRAEAPAGLWVGTTPAILGSVLTEGPVLAGADGVVLHVDAGGDATSLRSGGYRRSVDYGVQTAKRMDVPRAAVVTSAQEPGAASPQQRAWKLVTRHVTAVAAGAERVFFRWGCGLPRPRASAAAYAWMAHLLGDARYEGDAWADVPLLYGHVFSGPERQAAVVWSWVGGGDEDHCDRGVLVFEDGRGLEARDVLGHPIGIWKGRRLIVPFSEAPVYVVSLTLSAGQVRDRLRKARIFGIAPGTVRVESLIRGRVPGKTRVTLWVQSHRAEPLAGRAGLLLPDGWEVRDSKRRFDLPPGEAGEVSFECTAPEDAGRGPYPVEAVVSLDEAFVRHRQEVWRARTPKRTIEVGYGLADWDGIDPVVLEGPDGEVWAEVRSAWDEQFFYVSASVRRRRATFRAGTFAYGGDAVQLAWGTEGRADDDFAHPARGWALPDGAFRDTGHLMALTFGRDGAQVIRLRRPGVVLRSHVPGNLDPWYGPVEGARAVIARDGAIGHTVYEAAIPWEALAPLRGGRGRIYRFAFRVGRGDKPPLDWAREAGVPEFLANPCSFLPLSEPTLPCQTWWGMGGSE